MNLHDVPVVMSMRHETKRRVRPISLARYMYGYMALAFAHYIESIKKQ